MSGSRSLPEGAVCALAGNLPDFDRNLARALGVRRRDHHRWISHSFVGWLPPTLLALRVQGRGTRRRLVQRALACLWAHLLLDTYADGIAWLWPWHKEKIGCFRRDPAIKDRGWSTPASLTTELGRTEALLWASALLGLLVRRRR